MTEFRQEAEIEINGLDQTAQAHRIAFLRSYLKLRRFREKLFPGDLFADPAWDLILDLYVSGSQGKSVSISSACLAACVPPTTALRWVRKLNDVSLLNIIDDPEDRRRSFVSLSDYARQTVERWADQALNQWSPI